MSKLIVLFGLATLALLAQVFACYAVGLRSRAMSLLLVLGLSSILTLLWLWLGSPTDDQAVAWVGLLGLFLGIANVWTARRIKNFQMSHASNKGTAGGPDH